MSRITTRFLLPVGLFMILLCGLVLYRAHALAQHQVRELMDQQAALALEFDLAIRGYVADEIRPHFEQFVEADEFIPETMSTSCVARNIFERVRQRFPECIIKFSSDDPRNPANRATPDELRMIHYFNTHPDADRWSGNLDLDGREYYAHFSARRMKESCLRCHGEPDDAPTSLLERYGAVAGFRRPVGDVVALDMVAIPTDGMQAQMTAGMLEHSAILVVGIVLFFGVMVLTFRALVARRLQIIRSHLDRLSFGSESASVTSIDMPGRDEINGLAGSFNALAARLRRAYAELEQRVDERTRDLARANEDLQREIQERKQTQTALRESERRLRTKLDYVLSPNLTGDDVVLADLIDLDDLQRIQDAFAEANGVASLISDVDGHPITTPSNFCDVCTLIRETDVGRAKCVLSDKELGERAHELMEPTFEACHSCGFVDASAPIIVAGRHVANWLIGQCNPLKVDRRRIAQFAREIGADADRMLTAFDAMPQMTLERFEKVLGLLWILAGKISTLGYNNLTLARELAERKKAEKRANENAKLLRAQNMQLETQWSQLRAQQEELVAANNELERARAAAQAANEAKSEFLANMSHEIRTPMTAILGFADVLREDLVACDHCPDREETCQAPDRADAVETIKRNGEHLVTIINDILDLSKIEAGKLVVEQVNCCLPDLLAGVEAVIRPRSEAKGLQFDLALGEDIPRFVQTDPTRLRQILLNLTGNAVKFTQQGQVRLELRLLPDRGQGKRHLEFEITDTGEGMSAGQLQRAFEPFVQADNSTTRRHGGTGLGLTISRRLARKLGGDITVESSPGNGSTFRVTIALAIAEEDGPPNGFAKDLPGRIRPAATPSMPELSSRILLVEDGFDNQRLISLVLEKAGAKVTLATNGREAIEAVYGSKNDSSESDRPGQFDVILMDMQMPVMDGYEATTVLRTRGYTGPIIALTAHAMASDRHRCLAAGCDDYTTKPIDRNRLVDLIRKHSSGAVAGSAWNETAKRPQTSQ